MNDLRFEGQVAIVTGAGGNPGLGRAHAKYLAARGAKVVVNDLGVGPDGRGMVGARADAVVREICELGGQAVADTHSVATEEGANAIVQTALDAYGKVDILVNNAGVVEFALFEELSATDIHKILDTHLMGTIWMCRAVWPHMKQAGYGRIVNTVSGSLLGARYASVYGASKGGIMGLTRNLAIEGADIGVKVNALAPGAATVAWTTMSAEQAKPSPEILAKLSPDFVSPTVGALAHVSCPASGKCIGSEGGNVFELWYGRTAGYTDHELQSHNVHLNWDQVLDRAGQREIGDPFDGCAGFKLTPRSYRPS
ncbi:SDR family NAD(P)-dependent oxidoreductase [Herbaspirillum seropedicae]|uniref:SDR family NAD(P)-dependent oxidoreductase n=1 Tax=Herbaspirillum seropedicae TaxID=964 RepID=UPI0008638DC9|nr:SDR family NAD(P)-dependent oxidoreductase [Herbaspirillum seropedicae]AON53725.1 short chain dehydrogenase/reductase [Herbaspirillum seropedicae]